jgi:hypothetical protein
LDKADPDAIRTTDAAVQQVLKLADTYYASARIGHWFIPARNRRVIFLAAGLYEAIGHEISRLGPGAWRQRVSLSSGLKLRIIAQTIVRYRSFRTGLWSTREPPIHDSSIHRALAAAGFRDGIDPLAQHTLPEVLS